MRLRVIVIEPEQTVRESLAMMVEECGHEAMAFDVPENCPFYRSETCSCPQEHACADALLLGQHLPRLRGITLLERRLNGGCKGAAAHMALLCLPWSDDDHSRRIPLTAAVPISVTKGRA